ncbi:MAG: hypothetical protein ABI612_01345 [Betaproteobacteria bacterium]
MSLINQVLQDLEKRHADPEEIRGTARAVRALPEDRASRVRSIVIVAIAVMAVAGGSAWYFVEQRTSAQTPEAVSKVPDTPTPPARAIASSPAQASEVPAASVVSANAQTKSEDKVAQASIAPTPVSQSVAMATQTPVTAPVVQAKPEANSAAANKRAGIAANTTALLAPAKAVAPVLVAPAREPWIARRNRPGWTLAK